MLCRKCGKDNADDMQFCMECGADHADTAVPQGHSRSPYSTDTLGSVRTIPAAAVPPAKILAKQYRIAGDRPLGSGGMGDVWKAEDMELGTAVAIKVLPAALANDAVAISNLKREAMIGQQLSNDNICRLYGFHSDGATKFLVMEYMVGRTLSEFLIDRDDGRVPWEELEPIAWQIAGALDYAHRATYRDAAGRQVKGVLHRDIKPQNIMVTTDGQAKLMDFGIAHEVRNTMTKPVDHTSQTPLYASPEQFRGDAMTSASDVYSFAAVLYECLAGYPLVAPHGSFSYQILEKPYKALPDQNELVNAALRAGLSKDPSERPSSAVDLLSAIPRSKDRKVAEGHCPLLPASPDPDSYDYVPLDLGHGVTMQLAPIPAGTFVMGSPDGEEGRDADEGPLHEVEICSAFHMGVYQVTQSQWFAVMETKPWAKKEHAKLGDDHAANFVSWEDANKFCAKLSRKTGKRIVLPTEAQWEYACRAGSGTAYCFGDRAMDSGDYAWCWDNAWDKEEKYPHAVGRKRPNKWGLYDMHGNVWEWCRDWYHPRYYTVSGDVDPENTKETNNCVLRGGAWSRSPWDCRSAFRGWGEPANHACSDVGFRVAMLAGTSRMPTPTRSQAEALRDKVRSIAKEVASAKRHPHAGRCWKTAAQLSAQGERKFKKGELGDACQEWNDACAEFIKAKQCLLAAEAKTLADNAAETAKRTDAGEYASDLCGKAQQASLLAGKSFKNHQYTRAQELWKMCLGFYGRAEAKAVELSRASTSAVTAQGKAVSAREEAMSAGAEIHATNLWRQADLTDKRAVEACENGRFSDAASLWEETTNLYAKASQYAVCVSEVRAVRNEWNTALADCGESQLSLQAHGGKPWGAVQAALKIAQAAGDDSALAVRTYRKAIGLLPAAVKHVRITCNEHRFDQAMNQARTILAKIPSNSGLLTDAQKSEIHGAQKVVDKALGCKPADKEARALKKRIEAYLSLAVSTAQIFEEGGESMRSESEGVSQKDLRATETARHGRRRVLAAMVVLAVIVAIMIFSGILPIVPPKPQVASPQFSPSGHTIAAPVDVTITCGTESAEIRYTTDGGNPDESSSLFEGSIEVPPGTIVRARAFRGDWRPSELVRATYARASVTREEVIPVRTKATRVLGQLKGRNLAPEQGIGVKLTACGEIHDNAEEFYRQEAWVAGQMYGAYTVGRGPHRGPKN